MADQRRDHPLCGVSCRGSAQRRQHTVSTRECGEIPHGLADAAFAQKVGKPPRATTVELVAVATGQKHTNAFGFRLAVHPFLEEAKRTHLGIAAARRPRLEVAERPRIIARNLNRTDSPLRLHRSDVATLIALGQLVEHVREGRQRCWSDDSRGKARNRAGVEPSTHLDSHRGRRSQTAANARLEKLEELLRILLVRVPAQAHARVGLPVAPASLSPCVEDEHLGGEQLAYATEERPPVSRSLEGEEMGERFVVELEAATPLPRDRPRLRGDRHASPVTAEKHRPLAHRIARTDESLTMRVVDDRGELTDQSIEAGVTPPVVGEQQEHRIGSGREIGPIPAERVYQFVAIVDSAIERDGERELR